MLLTTQNWTNVMNDNFLDYMWWKLIVVGIAAFFYGWWRKWKGH